MFGKGIKLHSEDSFKTIIIIITALDNTPFIVHGLTSTEAEWKKRPGKWFW